MGTNPQLDLILEQLRLRAMLQQYDSVTDDATRANLSYDRYLQILAEHELHQREGARIRRYLQQAHIPVLKELADFDWSVMPSLNKARILNLAQGSYLAAAENVLLVGHPGLGKTHIATSLGVAACRQGQRSRPLSPKEGAADYR